MFEQADCLHPVGAGILLQPSGQAVLRELGLLDELTALCSPIKNLHGVSVRPARQPTSRIKPVMDLHYRDLSLPKTAHDSSQAVNFYGLGVHRANLCHVLHRHLEQAENIIQFGVNITRYEQRENYVDVFASNNPPATHNPADKPADKKIGSFDAVIVANGARSQLRPRGLCQPYAWGAFWSVLPNTAELPQHVLGQRYRRARQMLGLLPTGHLHNDPEKTPLTSLFWSVRTKHFADVQQQGIQAWKKQVTDLWPETAALIAPIEDFSQLIPAAYQDVYMRKWHDHRVLFIGDAGHGTSPQLGQGANLALVDANVLSHMISKTSDVTQAWRQYTQQRRSQLHYYVITSRWLTYGFQSNSRLLPWLRDLLTTPMSNPRWRLTNWIYQQMLLTLTGHKTGLFSDNLHAALHARATESLQQTKPTNPTNPTS